MPNQPCIKTILYLRNNANKKQMCIWFLLIEILCIYLKIGTKLYVFTLIVGVLGKAFLDVLKASLLVWLFSKPTCGH